MRMGSLARALLVAAVFPVLAGTGLAQEYGEPQDLGQVQADFLTEISGVVASRQNPGVLWVHNDSGGDNAIYALDMHGRLLGIYRLAGSRNRDWEDIAIGPGPESGTWTVYVGDIGDNAHRRSTKIIYRVKEPRVDSSQSVVDTTLYGVQRLVFAYPDGKHNAETLLVDPVAGDLYVANKSNLTTVYRVPKGARFFDDPTTHVDTLETVAHLLFGTAVAGDIDPVGREVLIKTYTRIYSWERNDGQSWPEALALAYRFRPYRREPQGEAIAWTANGDGYVTISEGAHPHIYWYPRFWSTVSGSRPEQPERAALRAAMSPSQGELEVTVRIGGSGPGEIRVYNIRGREVVAARVPGGVPGGRELRFETAAWASGVYIVQLRVKRKLIAAQRVVLVR